MVKKRHNLLSILVLCTNNSNFKIRILSKKNFVLRIDAQAFEAIEKWAADEFRSVNAQIEWIVDQALKKAGRKKKETAAIKKNNQ